MNESKKLNQCEQIAVRPDLTKLSHFGNIYKVLGNFLTVYILFCAPYGIQISTHRQCGQMARSHAQIVAIYDNEKCPNGKFLMQK